MVIAFGVTTDSTNTKFAPLVTLAAYYQAQNILGPLQSVTSAAKRGDFTLPDKLMQLFLSIMSGCEYIVEVNTKLHCEQNLAQVNRIFRFADQSTLAMALNELSQMNLDQLWVATRQISDRCSQMRRHDWRGFLALDFDLSGLLCGKRAEGSEKGFFSGKKTLRDNS